MEAVFQVNQGNWAVEIRQRLKKKMCHGALGLGGSLLVELCLYGRGRQLPRHKIGMIGAWRDVMRGF